MIKLDMLNRYRFEKLSDHEKKLLFFKLEKSLKGFKFLKLETPNPIKSNYTSGIFQY